MELSKSEAKIVKKTLNAWEESSLISKELKAKLLEDLDIVEDSSKKSDKFLKTCIVLAILGIVSAILLKVATPIILGGYAIARAGFATANMPKDWRPLPKDWSPLPKDWSPFQGNRGISSEESETSEQELDTPPSI